MPADASAGASPNEKNLRRLLFLRHGCGGPALYGDDGEMQCHACGIDFRRFRVEEIELRWERLADQRDAQGHRLLAVAQHAVAQPAALEGEMGCAKCGHIDCVCGIKKRHVDSCKFRISATSAVPIACEHGHGVCPKCDPCHCPAPKSAAVIDAGAIGAEPTERLLADAECIRVQRAALNQAHGFLTACKHQGNKRAAWIIDVISHALGESDIEP